MKNKKSLKGICISFFVLCILAIVSTEENTNLNTYNSISANIDNTIKPVINNKEEEPKEEPKEKPKEEKELEEVESPKEEVIIKTEEKEKPKEEPKEKIKLNSLGYNIAGNTFTYKNEKYKIINVYGGNRSGYRAKNVAVDIGYGDRKYYGLTNEYGQLEYVLAEKITLQNDNTEDVNKDGRYYDDEANVPGTEKSNLDQGHIIADSLGGVANAYNITPQDSILNRHGDQAYMEKVIRDAGGCSMFIAKITYPNTKTQTPSKYRYEYILRGNKIVDEFNNANPEGTYNSSSSKETNKSSSSNSSNNVSKIDSNHNGQVTIKEAKEAGFKMPISSDHWLYKYMIDGDGDGLVGE